MLKEKGRIRFNEDVGAVNSWSRGWWRFQSMAAVRAALLRSLHGDPADRIIVATAMEGHTLVTGDRSILDWSGDLGRLDARR